MTIRLSLKSRQQKSLVNSMFSYVLPDISLSCFIVNRKRYSRLSQPSFPHDIIEKYGNRNSAIWIIRQKFHKYGCTEHSPDGQNDRKSELVIEASQSKPIIPICYCPIKLNIIAIIEQIIILALLAQRWNQVLVVHIAHIFLLSVRWTCIFLQDNIQSLEVTDGIRRYHTINLSDTVVSC